MGYVFMNDPATGRVAIFLENGTSGDPVNPNSTRNAPLNNPVAHLSKVRFHSDFDYYQVHSITTVTINHAAVATASVTISTGQPVIRKGQVVKANHNLVAHGLPYVPAYMVKSGNGLIGQSSMIQASTSGVRYVSPYATATHIRLLDVGTSSDVNLSAISKTYQVIVFKQPVEDSSYMADIDPGAGKFILGKGKWRGELRQLRRTLLGDASPFDVPRGRTTDVRNGVSKTVLADGTTFAMPAYDGTFTGSPSVQCTVE